MGKLSLILAKEGRQVIATDISGPSLEKTRRIAVLHSAKVDCRLGDGLSVVHPGETEAIVLAGMGQNTIINIITQSREVVNDAQSLILQSMNGEYDLRSFVSEEGFLICDERVAIEANRIYCIIKAVPVKERTWTVPPSPERPETFTPLLSSTLLFFTVWPLK